MKKNIGYVDRTPGLSLTALATLCFVTLVLCQTRFKITKEMSRGEMYPPVLQSKDCWFLYSIGNPDRFKCVMRAFVVISSPILSLVSTGLVLLGKRESNPYLFIPWLFLTMKGLLLVQTDNLMSILRDMGTRANYAFGFHFEDLKWMIFYFTLFFVDLLEVFSFYEIFDLFLVLWNHHPGYDLDSTNLGVVKKNIAEIMDTLSKCSLGTMSKMSLGSWSDSDETQDGNDVDEMKNTVKFAPKEDKKLFDSRSPVVCFSKGEPFDVTTTAGPPESVTSDLVPNFGNLKFLNCGGEVPTSDSSDATNDKFQPMGNAGPRLRESCIESILEQPEM